MRLKFLINRFLTAAAVFAAASASGAASALSQAPADTVAWRITDSVMINPPGEGCCYGIGAYHLEFMAVGGWRRFPFAQLRPAQLPGASLLLRIVNADQSIVLRRFSRTGRLLSIVPRPPDYDSSYTWPEFNAPRRLLAYTVPVRGVGTRVTVREWPRWDLIAEGPTIERCDDALLDVSWSADARYVLWNPPHCSDSTAVVDSMAVPVR